MNPENDASFLDLSENEQAIISVLKDCNSYRPTDIAKQCAVKRTTINYNLKKLHERDIISKTKVKGHYEWKLADRSAIQEHINDLYPFFDLTEEQGKITLSAQTEVEASTGISALQDAYEELTELKKGERVYTIEANNLHLQTQKFGEEYLAQLQNQYKNAGIVIEGIISKQAIKNLKKYKADLLEHYRNRLVVVHAIDNELVDFDTHILIHRSVVKMINFEEKLVLSIKNRFIKQAMFGLYESLKSLGTKINLNKIIKEKM